MAAPAPGSPLPLQTAHGWRSIGSVNFPLTESVRLMPVKHRSKPARSPESRWPQGLEIRVGLWIQSLCPAPVEYAGRKRHQPKPYCCNFTRVLPQQPCANRVVTTRREPVVTTRTLPQRIRAYRDLSQVTTPRDGLPGTSLSQTTQHGLTSPALCGSPQPSRLTGAPQRLGSMAHIDGETSHRKRHRRQCRVPRRQPENSARNGSGVPCPS